MSPPNKVQLAFLLLAALTAAGGAFAVPKWFRIPMVLLSIGIATYGAIVLWYAPGVEFAHDPAQTLSQAPTGAPLPQTPLLSPIVTPTPADLSDEILLPTPTKIEILPPRWGEKTYDREFWDSRNCGYINDHGEWKIRPQWDRAYSFSDGLALVRHSFDEGLYYIDSKGAFVLKTIFPSHGGDFAENLAPAKEPETHLWGYMDRSGRFAIPPRFYGVLEFSEGLGAVMDKSENYGFVNRVGDFVIKPQWSEANGFAETLANVSRAGKWGYIDHAGKIIIPLTWNRAEPFSEDVATVFDGKYCRLIDKTGRILVVTEFDYVGRFSRGFAIARRNGKYGFIDKAGKPIGSFQWDAVLRDDFQGRDHRIYWNLARQDDPASAIVVWFGPTLNEIWRDRVPLIKTEQ